MKSTFILAFILVSYTTLFGQIELQPVDDTAGALGKLLGGDENTLSVVRLLSDTEQSVNIEVNYSGFNDKEYQIKGTVLNRLKKPVKSIEVAVATLSEQGNSIDLHFELKPGTISQKQYVTSSYLSLSISKSNDILGDLDLGGGDIFGNNFLYKLDKKWRVSGNDKMVVEVTLTPFKSAGNIQE